MEGLHHEEGLAECPRSLPQHLVWLHRDDRAKGKDERMNVLHVEVVGCHGVGHRVISQPLGKINVQEYYTCMYMYMYICLCELHMHTCKYMYV